MVPYSVQDEDLSVVIDKEHLIISVKGNPPIVKGRIYGSVDTDSCVWQLEPRSSHLTARERTHSTASTTSTHSSYAFVSDPDISSSFAASLESGPVSDAEDVYSPSPSSPVLAYADEGLYPVQRRKLSPNPIHSRSVSPGHAHPSMTSSFSSLDSRQSPQSGRLLTVHLEKEQSTIWPSLIVGPVPESLSSSISNTVVVFDANEESEEKYNMDPTSLALIALELSDIRKEKQEAFEYFLRSWKQAHVPSATMRLVSHYLPLESTEEIVEPVGKPAPGSTAYYLHSIGGYRGLAQLYLEAGLLHLEGAASTLLAASYSTLASIRIPIQAQIGEGGTEAWKRDREAAAEFFERARTLYPILDIPALPSDAGLELEMPIMHLTPSAPDSIQSKESHYEDSETEIPVVRRRRKREEEIVLEKPNTDMDDYDNTWYLYIPGIIGAGTALLVVGIVGALSFSNWSRRSQSS
uniref:CS domain-containing protein n=1 Tax=Psilocybe cubensis TaxID=181762 RepID=A0A8H7XYQ4_PSICU